MANRIVEWVAALDGWLLAVVLFGLAFGESAAGADLVVPGEVGMVVAGAAGERAGVPLWLLIAAGTAGAIVGDQISFHLGRRYGPRLVDKWEWTRRHLGPKIEAAEKHFERHGPATVFVGRWVGALRAVVPFVAGTVDMPLGTFVAWNVVGAASWVAAVVSLGYVFGRPVADLVDRYSLIISLLVVGALVAWWAVRALRRRHQPDDAVPSGAGR
jgi:undecaprenyl-diphosphatase